MRVEEGADNDGDDGKGQDVDVHQIVAHAKLRKEAGHEDADEDKETVPALEVELRAEGQEVERAAGHDAEDENHLAQHGDGVTAVASGLGLVDDLERMEDVVRAGVDHLAPIDDALARLHDAGGECHLLHERLQRLVGRFGVVGDVGVQVAVEVGGPQLALVHRFGRLVDDHLVGRLFGVEAGEIDLRGDVLAEQSEAGVMLGGHALHVLRRDDAVGVECAELLGEVLPDGRAHGAPLSVVVLEVAQGLPRDAVVESEVGPEACLEAVSLGLQLGVGLVDGEVAGGRQQAVAPGLTLVELVSELAFSRKEVGDHDGRGHEIEEGLYGRFL